MSGWACADKVSEQKGWEKRCKSVNLSQLPLIKPAYLLEVQEEDIRGDKQECESEIQKLLLQTVGLGQLHS